MQAKAYLAVVFLSKLVFGGIFAAPTSSSNCPPHLPQVYCFVDPCTVSTCPGNPNATCLSIYCGGCNAVWLDVNGKPAKCYKHCECPSGQGEVSCFRDPCQGETCPAYPNAKCVSNYCGGCNFDWFNSKGEKVQFLIPLLAILLSIIENSRYVSLPKAKYLGSIQDRLPSKSNEFGRYTKPFSVIDYSWTSSSKLFDFMALKHWDFKSISTSRYFIVAAVGNFNYIAHGFVYVVDRTNREKQFYQYASRSILAYAIKEQAQSSLDGCTHFYRSLSDYIRLCYNKNEKVYEIDANVPMNDSLQISFEFKIEFSGEKDQSMVLLYPVEENRPAYTHKIAGLPARGKISIGNNNQEDLLNGISSMDWTLAYSERASRWKWISLSVVGIDSSNNEPVTIGINLSDLVYNDENGVSMESAVWIAGQIYTVDKMVFELPEEQYQTSQLWQIYSIEDTSSGTPKIRLTFQPWGSQEEHINLILLAGDFVQAFGVYNGTIELFHHTYVIENGFGVAENHYAKW